MQARVDERGPLEAKEVLRIARQAAAGLAAAHAQGVVHRDVKPANILLEESVERVLISDFGLARTVDDATLTRTGVVAGTPHYMSPEQATGQLVDQRSDLFSLGSVIYFMCTGRPPFRAEHALAILNRICNDPHRPVDDVNSDVPAELADVVDRLLSKNPADRFRDAHEVERQLEAILVHSKADNVLEFAGVESMVAMAECDREISCSPWRDRCLCAARIRIGILEHAAGANANRSASTEG